MLITRLIWILEKFTTPDQLAFANEDCSFFFDHWSFHLFQSYQLSQVIEFVDWPVPEKFYIAFINLS